MSDETAVAPAPESGTEPADSDRRRKVLIGVIIGLLILLLIVGAMFTWYLVTRKPLTQIPILSQEIPPHYSQSVYGVAQPLGVALDEANDRMYVTQSAGTRTVLVFNLAGEPVGELKSPEGKAKIHVPVYVAVNPSTSEVFVSDRATATIYVYDSDGTYVREFKPEGTKDWAPLALSFSPDGTLYVTDVSEPTHEVWQFAPDGSVERTVGGEQEMAFPNGATELSDGSLAAADSNHGRVLIWGPGTDTPIGIARGSSEVALGMPRGLAVDDRGRLYVVDTVNNTVNVYVPAENPAEPPELAFTFGTQGNGDDAFLYPNGIAVDQRGKVYVADRENNRVQIWSY